LFVFIVRHANARLARVGAPVVFHRERGYTGSNNPSLVSPGFPGLPDEGTSRLVDAITRGLESG
jgi:hypothetical protein